MHVFAPSLLLSYLATGAQYCTQNIRKSPCSRDATSLPRPQQAPRSCNIIALADPDATRDSSKSVGDVVKGVHGGKYQFSSGGFEAFAGGEFAEALAASSSTEVEDANDAEPWPSWATELKKNGGNVETVSLDANGIARLRVTNIYRSWEVFYASFLDAAAEDVFEISPTKGHLAPRGGANNVCDESKPYSDSVELTVRMRGGDGGQRDGPCVCGVVVRTEENSWLFQLVAGSDGVSPAAGAAAAYPAAEAVDEEWQ